LPATDRRSLPGLRRRCLSGAFRSEQVGEDVLLEAYVHDP
jgi:hypothetical protein